jgi:hypothetical protein
MRADKAFADITWLFLGTQCSLFKHTNLSATIALGSPERPSPDIAGNTP